MSKPKNNPRHRALVKVGLFLVLILLSMSMVSPSYTTKGWQGTPLGGAGSIWYPGRETEIRIREIEAVSEETCVDCEPPAMAVEKQTEMEGETTNLTILNPYSKPTLYGNWIINFTTNGKGNLTISGIEATYFNREIEFIGLYCGNKEIIPETSFRDKSQWIWGRGDEGSLFVENWNCEGKGKLILNILMTGDHQLEFKFGGEVAYAYNWADCTGTLAVPCHKCDIVNDDAWVYIKSAGGVTSVKIGMKYVNEWGSCTAADPTYHNYTNTSVGYTFCPDEGQYTANFTVLAEGDANVYENSSEVNLYSVTYDTLQAWCDCHESYGLGTTIWLADGTGTGSDCCGDDAGEDWEQAQGAGRSICYNAAEQSDDTIDSSESLLAQDGQAYDCGSQITFDGGVDTESVTGDKVLGQSGTWVCNSSNQWVQDTTPPTVSEINVTPTYENNAVNYTNTSFLINATVADTGGSEINTSSCKICISENTPVCSSWVPGRYHQIDEHHGYCWNWSSAISDGNLVYINVSIEDYGGNLGGGIELNRTVDATGPTASDVMIKPTSGAYTNSTPYINATITDAKSGVASCEYSTNNGTSWSAASWNAGRSECYTTLSAQADGYVMNVTFRGTDNVGNVGTKATDVQRTVDAEAPSLPGSSVIVRPTYPFTYENLTWNVTCVDNRNANNLQVEYLIYNNSILTFSGNKTGVQSNTNTIIFNLTFGNTSVNEVWNLTARCWDGIYWSGYNSSKANPIGTPKFSKFNGSTTNFTLVADLTSVSNATLEIAKYGKIVWINSVNVTDAYFDRYVNITNNSIWVDTPNLGSSLDSSANLSLYNLTFTDVVILENNQRCTHCVKISYANGNLTFNVSHFTTFSATENTNLTIWDATDAKGGSETKYITNQTRFYANYTLTDGTIIDNTTAHNGTCQIKFNVSGWSAFENMTYNSTSNLYEYNRSFSSHGVLDYNITCNSSNLVSYISALDNVTITNRAPSVVLNSPGNDTWINKNFTLLNWTCTDPDGDTMTAYVYGDNLTTNPATTLINTTPNIVSGNSYTFNWTSLNETTYYWKVNCTDSGDLSGSDQSNFSVTYQFTVDTIAPTVGEVKVQPTHENLGVNYTNASFMVNASVSDAGSGINASTCEICNSTTTPCNSWTAGTYSQGYCYKLIGPFSDGNIIYVNVRISDNVSNLGTGSEVNRTVDAQGPTATAVMVKPTSGAYTNATPYINATITDAKSGVASCEYSTNNGTSWSAASWNAGRSECYTTLSAQADGYVMNVTFRGTDNVGNVGTKATDVQRTVDAAAPTTSNVAIKPTYGVYTNATPYLNATITDSVSGVTGCNYSLDNGTTWNTATWTAARNECSFQVTSSLTDGQVINVTFRGEDNVGNVGTKATDVQRTVDATVPTIGEVTVTPTHENNGINWTNSTMFVNASVTESGSGVNASTCEICNSTSTPCSTWTPGTYSSGYCYGYIKAYPNATVVYLNVRIRDNVSNLGTGTEINRTVDNESPVVTNVVVYPSTNGYTNSTPYINATAFDAGVGVSACQYSLDNGTTWSAAYYRASRRECYLNSSDFPAKLEGYVMNVTFRANDTFNQTSPQAPEVNLTVDDTPPLQLGEPMVTPSVMAGGINYTNTTPYINATFIDTASGVASCEYSIDNGTTWSAATWDGSNQCYATVSPAQADGYLMNVTFRATDNAGNLGLQGNITQRTVDGEPPAITALLVKNSTGASNDIFDINLTVSDSVRVNSSRVWVDIYFFNTTSSYALNLASTRNLTNDSFAGGNYNGTWNTTWDGDSPISGTYLFKFTAEDLVGNKRSLYGDSVALDYSPVESETNYTLTALSPGLVTSFNSSLTTVKLKKITVSSEQKNQSITMAKYHSDPTQSGALTNVLNYVEIYSTIADTDITTVMMWFYYTDAEMANAGVPQSREEDLAIYYYDPSAGTWSAIDDGIVIGSNYIYASKSMLTGTYAVGQIDVEAPITSHILVDPDPVVRGENITINATITDIITGVSIIDAAEFYIDDDSCALTLGSCTLMTNVTALDDTTERFTAQYNTLNLEPGTHTVYVRGNDSAGNWMLQPLIYQFTVIANVSTPVILNSSPSGFVNSSEQWLNVTTDVIAHCKYSQEDRNFSLMTSFTNTDATSHSVNVSSQINEGVTIFFVRCANDSSGKSAMQYSVTIHFTLDTQKPSLLTLTPANGAYTNDQNISFSIGDTTSGVNLSSLVVKWNGTKSLNFSNLTHCSENAHGGYNCPYNEGNITEGINTITIDAMDLAKNSMATAITNFTYDITTPTVSINSPVNNSVQNSQTITLNVSTNEAADCRYATLDVDYGNMPDSMANSSNYHYAEITVNEGANTYYVACRDLAGNEGKNSTTFYLNTTAPVVLNSSPTGHVTSAEQWLNVTTQDPAHCKYSQEDRNFSLMTSFTNTDSLSHSTNVSSEINEGINIFYVRCADDSAGTNAMLSSLIIDFILDTNKPVLLSLTPANEAYTNDQNVSFSIGDSEADVNLSSITVYWNGTKSLNFSNLTHCSENAHGGYNCSYNEGNITEGINTITLDAQDLAGNSMATALTNFTYDITPPTLSSPKPDSAQSSKHLNVSITTNENCTCRYAYDDVSWDKMGYSLTEVTANTHRDKGSVEKNDDYVIYFRCRDLAGNENYTNTPQFNVNEEDISAVSITIGGIEEDYRGGETVTIYASLTNKTGEPLNYSTYCNVTITHWNGTGLGTDLDNVAMNWTGITGWYYYLWTIPTQADKGSYGVLVRADPNEVDTQATSGFHVAEWAEEIGYLWEQYQRVNTSVIHNETLISVTLSSTSNISIHYNVTIPLKEGYTTSDYLPMRWKFWFIDVDTNSCVDQSREQRFIAPYCNPLIAQIIGLGNSTYEVNISIRPSLTIGNYTLVRELEVDPQQVWVSYGKGEVGSIAVLEDNTMPLADAEVEEKTVTTIPLELGGQCIELLIPVTTTILKEEEKLPTSKVIDLGARKEEEEPIKSKVISAAVRKESKKGNLIYLILGLSILASSIYLGFSFVKGRKEREEDRRWYER